MITRFTSVKCFTFSRHRWQVTYDRWKVTDDSWQLKCFTFSRQRWQVLLILLQSLAWSSTTHFTNKNSTQTWETSFCNFFQTCLARAVLQRRDKVAYLQRIFLQNLWNILVPKILKLKLWKNIPPWKHQKCNIIWKWRDNIKRYGDINYRVGQSMDLVIGRVCNQRGGGYIFTVNPPPSNGA